MPKAAQMLMLKLDGQQRRMLSKMEERSIGQPIALDFEEIFPFAAELGAIERTGQKIGCCASQLIVYVVRVTATHDYKK